MCDPPYKKPLLIFGKYNTPPMMFKYKTFSCGFIILMIQGVLLRAICISEVLAYL